MAERLSLQGNPALRDDWAKPPDGTPVDFLAFARARAGSPATSPTDPERHARDPRHAGRPPRELARPPGARRPPLSRTSGCHRARDARPLAQRPSALPPRRRRPRCDEMRPRVPRQEGPPCSSPSVIDRRPAPAVVGLVLIADRRRGARPARVSASTSSQSIGRWGWPFFIIVPGVVLLAASLVPAPPKGSASRPPARS